MTHARERVSKFKAFLDQAIQMQIARTKDDYLLEFGLIGVDTALGDLESMSNISAHE